MTPPRGRRTISLFAFVLQSLYFTVLCVNMSKISVRPLDAVSRSGLASPILSHYVENNGFEPLTPCLQSRCSSQLS